MSGSTEPAIQIAFQPTNPGQFFACCGLLELADRLWGGVEGWFAGNTFHLRPTRPVSNWSAAELIDDLAQCPLTNTMTAAQHERHEKLSAMPKKVREADAGLEAEKKSLDALHREAPVVLGAPLRYTIDWFQDDRSGGSDFKTWAGQQSVVDIASGMQRLIEREASAKEWLFRSSDGDGVPFQFDSDIGSSGSALDLGFSMDPLKATGLKTRTRPMLELAAFVGLQRFRPRRMGTDNVYHYFAWGEPLLPEAAAPVVCGAVECLRLRGFRFSLLYRTKYLKSFLPAAQL
ncbi:MAG TPA: type I-U CRISPR-associated protein Cas8c [Bryobacteraceae bacterium]|nr:type I-U CRISPR-associated protein Cas8c [Bryobacteraceae bacterium]